MFQSGFTLVELLMTLGIICTLVALLFPALSKVREKANASACSANLRQMVTQATVWSTDNDGWVPPARWQLDTTVDKGGVPRKLRQCPSMPPLPIPAPGKSEETCFGINNRLVQQGGSPTWGPGDVYFYTHGIYKLAALTPKTILFADSIQSAGKTVGYYMAMTSWFDARHGKFANVAYVDGHVEPKTSAELKDLAVWKRGIPDQDDQLK